MEGPHAIVERYGLDELSVSDFDACMLALAADRALAGGGCNKLFGELTWCDDEGEGSISLRIDVDANRSEGEELDDVLASRARFCKSDKGAAYYASCGHDAAKIAALYLRAIKAVIAA